MVELVRYEHGVGQSAYHFVFRPKYNKDVFRHAWVRDVCDRALRASAARHGMRVYEMKVMPNHVHIFLGLPSTMSVAKAFQLLKGSSARVILRTCDRWRAYFSLDGRKAPSLWSPGKFFRSVGNVSADVVQNYIANSNRWDFAYLDKAQQRLT